uniref:TSP1_spondin domain-containing protein n=1 Tax=Angiostrongylus cantonensis TaxID=6313 RepID=A0A0K0D3H3_ANGCA
LGVCQTWSDWCEWSTCSGSCGIGERTRTRFCYLENRRCEGKDFEVNACNPGPCPEWEEWNEWSSCSTSCGVGVSRRRRSCLGGALGNNMCLGPSSEQRFCEEALCPLWTSWVEWGACSVTCGVGTRHRYRTCQYGTDCPGPQKETIPCYGSSCPAWTEWCEWSRCSVKCGPGQRTRTRECVKADGARIHACQGLSMETTLCEGTVCCQWSDWCHWSMCDRECGGGQSIRTRICLNTQVQLSQCQGTLISYKKLFC